jgi:putative redox protein
MTIRVVRDQRRPMRHEIHFGESTLTTDISVEEGGETSGPNPHDLYDAALGACMALVSVDRDASQERMGVYRLSTALAVTGDLSAAQREEILRVARQCPIHKLMTEVTTEISTTLTR